jgi:hypothetical protein
VKKLQRKPRPQKKQRQRIERSVHRDRLRPSRVFRVRPDKSRPFVVEVRISKHRSAMRDEMSFHEGAEFAMTVERECMGLVRSWWGPRTRRAGVVRPRGVVARMFLNTRDLRNHPSTIVPHESTHAAMAWARFRGVSLDRAQSSMPDEEVIAYAVGDLVRQINRVCFAHGVW